jgi:hypothetical protein
MSHGHYAYSKRVCQEGPTLTTLQGAKDRVRLDVRNRLWYARKCWEMRQEPIRNYSDPEIGELVGKLLGREAFEQATVWRWFNSSIPEEPSLRALGELFGATFFWLRYGEGDPPPFPHPPKPMPRPKRQK